MKVDVICYTDLLAKYNELPNEEKRKAVIREIFEKNNVIEKVTIKGIEYFVVEKTKQEKIKKSITKENRKFE